MTISAAATSWWQDGRGRGVGGCWLPESPLQFAGCPLCSNENIGASDIGGISVSIRIPLPDQFVIYKNISHEDIPQKTVITIYFRHVLHEGNFFAFNQSAIGFGGLVEIEISAFRSIYTDVSHSKSLVSNAHIYRIPINHAGYGARFSFGVLRNAIQRG